MLHCINCHKKRIIGLVGHTGFVGTLYALSGLFHVSVPKEASLNFTLAAYLRMHNVCCEMMFKGDIRLR